MILTIKRKWKTDKSTISELSVDGKFFCFVLEPPTPKSYPGVKGKSCFPLGAYRVTLLKYHGEVWEWMRTIVPEIDTFGLPLISNIPGQSYPVDWTAEDDGIPHDGVHADRHVYFHVGNTAADTLGCNLPGYERLTDRVNRSTAAFRDLYLLHIVPAIQRGESITAEYI